MHSRLSECQTPMLDSSHRKKGDRQMTYSVTPQVSSAFADMFPEVEEFFDTTYCSGCLNRHDPWLCPNRG